MCLFYSLFCFLLSFSFLSFPSISQPMLLCHMPSWQFQVAADSAADSASAVAPFSVPNFLPLWSHTLSESAKDNFFKKNGEMNCFYLVFIVIIFSIVASKVLVFNFSCCCFLCFFLCILLFLKVFLFSLLIVFYGDVLPNNALKGLIKNYIFFIFKFIVSETHAFSNISNGKSKY